MQGVPSVGHQCVTQIPAEECTCNYSTVPAHSKIPGYHYSTVTTMPRARSLPCLLNSIWKHNERMTELTTLTSKLLHQCFHPLAFSFSTHHFPLLCNWETVTTSESWGWSYMKGAEGFEPTLMWLAPSLHALWFLLTVTPAIFFSFSQVDYYFVFSPAKACSCLSGAFHPNLKCQSFIKWKHNYFTIYIALSVVWTRAHMHARAHTHTRSPSSRPPESRQSWRPPRPTLTKTTI